MRRGTLNPCAPEARGLLSSSSVLIALAVALAPSPARAAGALRAPLIDAKSIKLDGVPKEWPAAMVHLDVAVKGKPSKPDLDAQALVAYDEARVYVAADVTDDTLRAGADHLELALGFPGGAVEEVALYPGDPGKSAGSVKLAGGRPAAGAKIIEAPRSGGYTLEASIPWSAFPEAATVRVGLRAALFAHDADGSGAVETIAGTAPSAGYAALGPLVTEPEQALADGLIKAKGLHNAPAYDLIADVAGDAMKERVLMIDRYLVVLGPGFRRGTQYYFADLGSDARSGMVPYFEARDVTGDGQAEILLRKRYTSGGHGSATREMLEVLQFGAAETPTVIFRHEVGIKTDRGSVDNQVSFVPDGPRTAIRIEPGEAKGLDAGSYAEPMETSFDPVLLPWGTIKSQLYKLSNGLFSKANEQTQAPTRPAAPSPPEPSPASRPAKAPPAPSSAQLLEQVVALYKKERGVSGRPRFDFVADMTGGRDVERVLLHDRDLVVFGRGFKGGTGYSYLTLSQFASPSDIEEVSPRDVTGEGKAEILVKGVLHAAAPREAGGGTVDREVILVFQVDGESIRRIFAAEIGRSMGNKRVSGELKFIRTPTLSAIELWPGKAVEWTDKTYPFNQDTGPVGGFEPLLLPWGGATGVRYTWSGSAFVR